MCATCSRRRNGKNRNEEEDMSPFQRTCLADFQQDIPYFQEAYLTLGDEFSRACIVNLYLQIESYNFRVLAETQKHPEGPQNRAAR